MATIDLFVCITGKASEYAEFTKMVSSKLLSGKHNIQWKYIVSGEVERTPNGYEYVATAKFNSKSSANHGVAINKAFEEAVADYVIMLDVDFVFLHEDWDDVIVSSLDLGYAAFGSGSPEGLDRALNFPFIYCFCYKSSLLKGIKLNFKPRLDRNCGNLRTNVHDKIDSEYKQKVTGLPIGSRYIWETSSRIPFIFYENNLKSKSLDCFLGGSKNIKMPFIDEKSKNTYLKLLKKSKKTRGIKGKVEYMEEFHHNGELFGTHLRKSSHSSFNNYFVQHWVKRIKLYLQQRYNIELI
jgi:glycosyltransferase involved in cell wall biosynthesis